MLCLHMCVYVCMRDAFVRTTNIDFFTDVILNLNFKGVVKLPFDEPEIFIF